jgi:hypothetical protein
MTTAAGSDLTLGQMKAERRLWPDLLPAVLLTAAGFAMTQDPSSGGGTFWDTVLVPFVTVPVFWWRRAPYAAAIAIAIGMVISGIPTFEQLRCGFAFPSAFLILFGLGAYDERDRGLLGLVAVLAGMVFIMFTDPQIDIGGAFILIIAAGAWGAGRLYQSRTKVAGELAARTRDLEATRSEAAQAAAEVERSKVAADLDVAARDKVKAVVEKAREGEAAPADSKDAFEEIEGEGRESLNRMRELLGILRGDGRESR